MKHFVCPLQGCNNRCDRNHGGEVGGGRTGCVNDYRDGVPCQKCGRPGVRTGFPDRDGGYVYGGDVRTYRCGKCGYLYCYSCCFQ